MDQLQFVYSNHRPETLPFAADLMRRYAMVFLEEPADPDFDDMLSGACDIDTYVSRSDSEYPEFSRKSCLLFRELHAGGIRFFQIEPFLDQLLQIHEMFADGQTPADIPNHTPMMQVYAAEKRATQALIKFYAAVASKSFDQILAALKRFAQSDAARFRVRDEMRAYALAAHTHHLTSAYIEVGTMHVWLRKVIKQLISSTHRIGWRHLMAAQTKALTGRSFLMGPGDILTMYYIFNPHVRSIRCDELAAKSLIYNKIIAKQELLAGKADFPHIRDEWQAIQTVRSIGITECEALFTETRQKNTAEAKERVEAYLRRHRITR